MFTFRFSISCVWDTQVRFGIQAVQTCPVFENDEKGKKIIENVSNCFREEVKIVAWLVESDTLQTTLIQEMYPND